MIKDVMVRLDGTSGDDVRLAAVNQIAEIFESHITGLFFNVLPSLAPDGLNGAGAGQAAKLLDTAKQAGDIIAATIFERLTRLRHPSNLRRFDVIGYGDISDTRLPLARAVDAVVALRPSASPPAPRYQRCKISRDRRGRRDRRCADRGVPQAQCKPAGNG